MAGGKFEMKDMTGSLFKNEDKQEETHADYNGSIVVHGEHFWLNAWIKTAKNGQKYMGLSIKPKQQQGQGRSAPAPQGNDQRGTSNQYGQQSRGGEDRGGGAPQRDWSKKGGDDVPFSPF